MLLPHLADIAALLINSIPGLLLTSEKIPDRLCMTQHIPVDRFQGCTLLFLNSFNALNRIFAFLATFTQQSLGAA